MDVAPPAVSALTCVEPPRWLEALSPPSKTYQRTASSVRSRQQLLYGKKILFICCGLDGIDSKRFIFERVQKFGVLTYLVEDPNNTLAAGMERDGLIFRWIKVNMNSRPSLAEEVCAAVRNIEHQDGKLDGVTTFWDDAVGLYARVNAALGLKGNSVEAVDTAHCKWLTRQAMDRAGLPVPRYKLLRNADDVKAASEELTFPVIMKPAYGGSSLGVLKCETKDSVLAVYREVLRQLHQYYEEGELMGLTFVESSLSTSNEDNELFYLVMEEFLDGDEVDVDILMDGGRAVYCRICDDWPQIEPWFVEMGTNCPSVLPPEQQSAIADMALATVKSLGFQSGLLHVELKNTSRGPRIIEVNPRMGGGPLWQQHFEAFGVDLIEEQMYAVLGLPVNALTPQPNSFTSCVEKFFKCSCIVSQSFYDKLQTIAELPNVILSIPLLDVGAKVVGFETAFPTRTARIIVKGPTAAEAMAYAGELLAQLDVADMTDPESQLHRW